LTTSPLSPPAVLIHAVRSASPPPSGRPACLLPAIKLAVRHRGWPARLVRAALLAVAADPSTRSPMRLAEAGPWWDQADEPNGADDRELAEWSAQLDELDGRRRALQAQARAELESEHMPLTRSSMTRRAVEILGRRFLRGVPCRRLRSSPTKAVVTSDVGGGPKSGWTLLCGRAD
jgi:hypothetical protein